MLKISGLPEAWETTDILAPARHLIVDDTKADATEAEMRAHRPEDALAGQALALMRYAEKLTPQPSRYGRGRCRRPADRGAR